jgi:hypothetical protein
MITDAMITLEELSGGATLAEAQGMTEELGRAAAELAARESDPLVARAFAGAAQALSGR